MLRLTRLLLVLCAIGLFFNLYRTLPSKPPPIPLYQEIELPAVPPVKKASDLLLASSLPSPAPHYTKIDCQQRGTICHYTNLCYDGQSFVVLADDSEVAKSNPTANLASVEFPRGPTSHEDSHPVPDENVIVPPNQRLAFRTMPASKVFGKRVLNLPFVTNTSITVTDELTAQGPAVVWLNGSFLTQGSDMSRHGCYNLYHWSIGTTPLWAAQFWNLTASLGRGNWLSYRADGGVDFHNYDAPMNDKPLPPVDYVLSLCGELGNSWTSELVRSVLPNSTKILWLRNLGATNADDPSIVVPGDHSVWKGASELLATGEGNLGLAPEKRLLCAKRAVVMSYRYTIFSDAMEWRTFRAKVLNYLNLDELAQIKRPPPRVVFKSTGRDLKNMDELIEVCRKYTTCEKSSVWNNFAAFETQVREVASAGIFVGVHGAGMVNGMWLPPGGVMVELFPYKWWPDMFRMMAQEMRIPYFMVTTYKKPPKQTDDRCAAEAALSYTKGSCAHGSKYETFEISPQLFERTLVDALQLIGINAVPPAGELS